jgi:hypothetical protein
MSVGLPPGQVPAELLVRNACQERFGGNLLEHFLLLFRSQQGEVLSSGIGPGRARPPKDWSVLLPARLRPMMPTTSPRFTSNDTSRSAQNSRPSSSGRRRQSR